MHWKSYLIVTWCGPIYWNCHELYCPHYLFCFLQDHVMHGPYLVWSCIHLKAHWRYSWCSRKHTPFACSHTQSQVCYVTTFGRVCELHFFVFVYVNFRRPTRVDSKVLSYQGTPPPLVTHVTKKIVPIELSQCNVVPRCLSGVPSNVFPQPINLGL